MKPLTTNEFIERVIKIHDNKFDYSKVNYINNHTNIKIVCNIHGEFLQSPKKHLIGHKCPRCSITRPSNTNKFIKKSSKLHNNLYDYSKVKYINCETKVEIICKKHGSYLQIPSSHLTGRGCPKCKFEKLSNITISRFQLEFLDLLKINNRNVNIGNFIVDGIKDDVIYEFLGDYWHGNPQKFNHNKFHPHYKKTFGKVYDYTFNRFKKLKDFGYTIKYIWETDWNNYKNKSTDQLKISEFV